MNGIGLLVLIAAAGQLGATPPSLSNTPPSLSNNFGWDFDNRSPDHALCYIIQVSPQQAEEMQRTDQEFPSSMPPDLVGRATRILVRIGTDPLPQNPPLEELRKMPRVYPAADVTAGLGGGRLSDVEPDSLINVQQDRSPTLPAFPNQGLPSPPPDTSSASSNLADRLQKGAANLADEVKSLARGTPGFPNAAGNAAADATPPLPGFGGTGPAGRFENSALDNNTTNPPRSNSGRFADNAAMADNNPANDWRPPVSNLGSDRSRDASSTITDNRPLNPYGAGNIGGTNIGNQQDYDPRVPPSLTTNLQTSVPNVQTPSNGFGTYNGNQGPNKFGVPNSSFDNSSTQSQYGQNQFPQGAPEVGGQGTSFGGVSPGQGNAPYTPPPGYGSQPSANGQFISGGGIGIDNGSRIAANGLPPANNDIQGQGTGLNGAGLATGQGGFSQSPNDNNSDAEKALARPKTFDNILSVILLLSLLVNGYMGALIRKLLTRYRTLLANMRGQSIPNTFGA